MEREKPVLKSSSRAFGDTLWLVLFAVYAMLLPQQLNAGEASYTVTETIETIEYDIVEPEQSYDAPILSGTLSGQQYGPFQVISADKVQMSGTVDSYSPAAFATMLRAHPGIRTIEMVDCDGSVDEEANLQLARLIRRAGISTHVPAGGSIRSGAVELFLAGVRNTAAPDAEFLVHSWMDEDGMEANDYPDDDPVHAEYLDYYAEMGIPAQKARAFYNLTNSVPFSESLRLSRQDLAQFQMLN